MGKIKEIGLKNAFSILLLFLSLNVIGQFDSINYWQAKRMEHIFSDQRDTIWMKFEHAMHGLIKEISCNTIPNDIHDYVSINPSFETYDGTSFAYYLFNQIVVVGNENLRVISVDELGGGSGHFFYNYLQYQDEYGECHNLDVSADLGLANESFFRLETVPEVSDSYILLGYGTGGSGKEHYQVRILNIEGSEIQECMECYPESRPVYIGCNRAQDVNLRYDSRSGELSFLNYEFDGEMGFYTDSSKLMKYRFEEGRLMEY